MSAVRDAGAVGEIQTRTQARADQQVAAHAGAVPRIGRAAGHRHLLLVVEMDVVAGDISQIVGGEVELARLEILADRALERDVAVRLEMAGRVVAGEFHAVHLAVAVIERRQDDGRTELTLVDEVDRLLVIAVHADGESFGNALLDADVVVVRALGLDRVVLGDRRLERRVEELLDGGAADQLERRRREEARVAGVHGGVFRRLPHEVHARAELAAARERREVIEAHSIVHHQHRVDVPLILQIRALDPLGIAGVVDDADGQVAHLGAAGIRRQHLRGGVAGETVGLRIYPGAQRVGIAELVGAVALQPVGHVALVGLLRDAVEEQIAERVRREIQARVAGDERGLHAQGSGRVLQAHRAKLGDLALILVQHIAQEIRLPVDRQPRPDVGGVHPAEVRNLEAVIGAPGHDRQAVALIEDVLEIAESMVLPGVVVQRRGAAVRGLDPQVVADHVAGDEVGVGARGATVIDTRLDRTVAAAVHGHVTAGLQCAALGGEIDDAGAAQAVLRRQASRDQLHRSDHARRQRLAEDADAVGQDDAVQAELQTVVIAADVQLPEGVLGGVGYLQHDLVQLHVVPTRGRLDVVGVEGIGGSARLGVDPRALLVQMLGGDHDGGQAGAGLIGHLCECGHCGAHERRRGERARNAETNGEHRPDSSKSCVAGKADGGALRAP